MNHRQMAAKERLEVAMAELLSIAEGYFGVEVMGSAYGKRIAKIPDGPASRNQKRIATQLAIINNIFQVMEDISAAGQDQCHYALESILLGSLETGVKTLTVPRSPAEMFRRDVLRGLFNAIRARMPDKTNQSLRLGVLWFKSSDDPVMRNPEIPK